MTLGFRAQPVEHNTRLHTGRSAHRIEFDQLVEIFREIEDDGYIAALPRETRPASAREQRGAVPAALRDGRDNVLDAFGHDDADGHLPVVRSVRGVESTAAIVEADLAFDALFQLGFEIMRFTGRVISRVRACPGDLRFMQQTCHRLCTSPYRSACIQCRSRGVLNPGTASRLKARPRPRRTSPRSCSDRKSTQH